MEQNQKKTEPSSKPNPEPNAFIQYSGIAFELFAINAVYIGGGYYLDQKFSNAVPWITILAVFLSVFTTVYYLIKKFSR